MKQIDAPVIYHIRLGRNSKWAEYCIRNGILKFGYNNVPHKICKKKDWDLVRKKVIQIRKKRGKKFHKPTISRAVNVIRIFYESDENVMWITFYGEKMWWCNSKTSITVDSNNDKERRVIEKWKNHDINNNPLFIDEVGTAITKIRRVEGTISTFNEKQREQILNIINNKKSKEVIQVNKSLDDLKKKLGKIVQDLHWKDFELLIDLIFRQGGWQRIKPIGGSEETLDLTLISPITKEKIWVQVKSHSTLKEFKEYQTKFKKMPDIDKKFYVVSTSDKKLNNYRPSDGTYLWTLEGVVDQIINLGLVNWLVTKSR